MNIHDEKKFVSGLSIVSNTLITLLKLFVGIISGSISIVSEAIHSMSDCLASILTFFAVLRSSKPADKEHPFGHGRYEDVAGFIEGILIILASFYIIFESCKKIILHSTPEFDSTLGIIVMSITVLANLFVSNCLYRVSKKTDSVALKADAKHLSTDIYSSLGVLIGLVLIKITGITILDPLIAIFIAVVILQAGVAITKETLNNLVDGTLPDEDLKIIINILSACEQIDGYTNLKGRKSGSGRDIDVTLLCNENMSLKECHDICDFVESEVIKLLPHTQITIHCEPFK